LHAKIQKKGEDIPENQKFGDCSERLELGVLGGEMRTSVATSSSLAQTTRGGSGRGSTKQEGRRDC